MTFDVKRRHTLFCYSVYTENTGSTKKSYELELLSQARAKGISIFACDASVVYGDAEKDLGGGVKVNKVCDLDELSEIDDLKAATAKALLVVMCSTCGHGDFPQNSGLFWSALSSGSVPPKELQGMRFCTFGMGDRSYADSFCEAAKKIEARLLELGATAVLEMGIGDDRDEDKWETGFSAWLPKFWAAIKAPEPEDDGAPKPALFELKWHEGAAVATTQICPPGCQLLTIQESGRELETTQCLSQTYLFLHDLTSP